MSSKILVIDDHAAAREEMIECQADEGFQHPATAIQIMLAEVGRTDPSQGEPQSLETLGSDAGVQRKILLPGGFRPYPEKIKVMLFPRWK